MSADFLAEVPTETLRHAMKCLNSDNPAELAAYLTGVAVGSAQGRQIYAQLLDEYAEGHAHLFTETLGEPPRSIPGYDFPLSDEQRRAMFSPLPDAA